MRVGMGGLFEVVSVCVCVCVLLGFCFCAQEELFVHLIKFCNEPWLAGQQTLREGVKSLNKGHSEAFWE